MVNTLNLIEIYLEKREMVEGRRREEKEKEEKDRGGPREPWMEEENDAKN